MGAAGREDIARMFVPYAVGRTWISVFSSLSERRITVVCHRVAKNIATTATGVETEKIKGFSVGFIVVRFFR